MAAEILITEPRPGDTWLTARVWRDSRRPREFRLRPVDEVLIRELAPFCETTLGPGDARPEPALRLTLAELEQLVDLSQLPYAQQEDKFLAAGTILTVTCPWDNCCALAGDEAYALLVDPDVNSGISLVL